MMKHPLQEFSDSMNTILGPYHPGAKKPHPESAFAAERFLEFLLRGEANSQAVLDLIAAHGELTDDERTKLLEEMKNLRLDDKAYDRESKYYDDRGPVSKETVLRELRWKIKQLKHEQIVANPNEWKEAVKARVEKLVDDFVSAVNATLELYHELDKK